MFYNFNSSSPKKIANCNAILRVYAILKQNGVNACLSSDEKRNTYISIAGRKYAVTTNLPENAELCNHFITESENNKFFSMNCQGIILYHTGLDMFTKFDSKYKFCAMVEEHLKWLFLKKNSKQRNDVCEYEVIDDVVTTPKSRKKLHACILDYLSVADQFGYMTEVK